MKDRNDPLISKGHTVLVVVTACGLTVTIIALAITLAVGSYRATLDKAGEDVRFISSLVAAQMGMVLVDVEGSLEEISSYLEATPPRFLHDNTRELQDLLKSIQRGEPYVDSLQVTTAQGMVVSRFGPHVPGELPRELLGQRQDEDPATIIGLPVEDPQRPGTWLFEFSRGVWNGRGEATHIVTAVIDLDALLKSFSKLEVPSGTNILLTNLSGRVFLDEPNGRPFIGRTLPSLREHIVRTIQGGTFIGKSALENRDIVAGSTLVQRFPLMVFASRSLEQVLEPWRQHAITYGGLSLVLVLVSAGMSAALVRSQIRVNAQSRALALAAAMDQLTGALNRRSFLTAAKREFARVGRYGGQLACVMLDLDHFKQINDTYGHPAGDLALSESARFIGARLRESDLFCRYGGEEFVILLPGTDMDGACVLAETLRAGIAKMTFRLEEKSFTATASFGVATVSAEDNPTLENLLVQADKALYLAKTGGRNQVRRADRIDTPEQPAPSAT